MKFRKIALCLLLVAALTGCGNQTAAPEAAGTTAAQTDAAADTTAAAAETTQAAVVETEPETEPAPTVFEDCGITMPIPEGFARDESNDNISFLKEMGDGTSVHLDYVCYSIANSEPETQAMSLDESVGFLQSLLYFHIYKYYELSSDNMQFTEETKTETTFLGTPAYEISGEVLGIFDENTKVAYKAYYTMIPLKVYDGAKIPLCYIAFGEDTEANRAEINAALDCFVGQAEGN